MKRSGRGATIQLTVTRLGFTLPPFKAIGWRLVWIGLWLLGWRKYSAKSWGFDLEDVRPAPLQPVLKECQP